MANAIEIIKNRIAIKTAVREDYRNQIANKSELDAANLASCNGDEFFEMFAKVDIDLCNKIITQYTSEIDLLNDILREINEQ